MLFCRNCGQCVYISEDMFKEYFTTRGWESYWVDANTGDCEDHIDGETTESDHDNYECPHCGSGDVDNDWDGSVEEATSLREDHTKAVKDLGKRRKKLSMLEKSQDPDRKWDLKKNVI